MARYFARRARACARDARDAVERREWERLGEMLVQAVVHLRTARDLREASRAPLPVDAGSAVVVAFRRKDASRT